MTLAGLRSPVSGAALVADTPHSLAEPDGRRWPVVDSIPFLRADGATLASAALAALDRGDEEGALVLLLADQDPWWRGATASEADLRHLARERDGLTLRDAMALLAWGPVADYFAHRWSDPTFLAGLALVEAHGPPPRSVFELACGIGHYGREFVRRGVDYTGADVVFAKLWVARHWVVGDAARLLCFDAAAPWPSADGRFDLCLCEDAFYFLEPKGVILARLRCACGPSGRLAVGHVHNGEAANFSAGAAVTATDLAELFPQAVFYDDAELTRALAEARRPVAAGLDALRAAAAFAVASGPGCDGEPRALTGGLTMPMASPAAMRLNPLYAPGEQPGRASDGGNVGQPRLSIVWPSDRYRDEYAGLATYPVLAPSLDTPEAIVDAVRTRVLVDLPERW